MEIEYRENGDLAIFDGHKFRRDKKTGYYLCSSLRKRLHRYVWEYFNGDVPDGCHIHHKDGDKTNNDLSNLELLTAHDHEVLHGTLLSDEERNQRRENVISKAMPKAKFWHGTEAGKIWHSEHAKNTMKNRKENEYICEMCHKPFVSKKVGDTKFCSNGCKSAYRRKSGIDNETRVCAWCGEHFLVNKYSKSHTCSRSCRQYFRWNVEVKA